MLFRFASYLYWDIRVASHLYWDILGLRMFRLGTSTMILRSARSVRVVLATVFETFVYMFFSACMFPICTRLHAKQSDKSVSKSMVKHPQGQS